MNWAIIAIIVLIILIIIIFTMSYKGVCGEIKEGPCDCSADPMSSTCIAKCFPEKQCYCEQQKKELQANIDALDAFIAARRAEKAQGQRPQWTSGGKAGSVGSGNQPMISTGAAQYCKVIVDGIRAHENSHIEFLKTKVCPNPFKTLWSKVSESYRNELVDESEFESYAAQRSFLKEKLDEPCVKLTSSSEDPNQPSQQRQRLKKAEQRVNDYLKTIPVAPSR